MLFFRGLISDVDRYPTPGNTISYNCFVGPTETSCFIPPSYPHHLVLIYRSTPHFRSEPHFVFSARDKIITACPVQSTSFESEHSAALLTTDTHFIPPFSCVWSIERLNRNPSTPRTRFHDKIGLWFVVRDACMCFVFISNLYGEKND